MARRLAAKKLLRQFAQLLVDGGEQAVHRAVVPRRETL
jgi:hypothetical protein